MVAIDESALTTLLVKRDDAPMTRYAWPELLCAFNRCPELVNRGPWCLRHQLQLWLRGHGGGPLFQILVSETTSNALLQLPDMMYGRTSVDTGDSRTELIEQSHCGVHVHVYDHKLKATSSTSLVRMVTK